MRLLHIVIFLLTSIYTLSKTLHHATGFIEAWSLTASKKKKSKQLLDIYMGNESIHSHIRLDKNVERTQIFMLYDVRQPLIAWG